MQSEEVKIIVKDIFERNNIPYTATHILTSQEAWNIIKKSECYGKILHIINDTKTNYVLICFENY